PPLATPFFFFSYHRDPRDLHSFPTRRSSDLRKTRPRGRRLSDLPGQYNSPGLRLDSAPLAASLAAHRPGSCLRGQTLPLQAAWRSEEHTSELQSPCNLVCRLLLEKKKQTNNMATNSRIRAMTRSCMCNASASPSLLLCIHYHVPPV